MATRDVGFNPLTGISSILTDDNGGPSIAVNLQFQSPDGDFVYFDSSLGKSSSVDSWAGFNPLTGISSILTDYDFLDSRRMLGVSIP